MSAIAAPWAGCPTRVCRTCEEEKPLTGEFYGSTGPRHYFQRECRKCVSRHRREGRRKERKELGLLDVVPLREMLMRMWKNSGCRQDDFAELVGLRPRAFSRILYENRHVQFDLADRVLCNTPYSFHDLYPEYREDDQVAA